MFAYSSGNQWFYSVNFIALTPLQIQNFHSSVSALLASNSLRGLDQHQLGSIF